MPGAHLAMAAGFYGKVPALGDFVGRGLPASFVDPFDLWLRAGLAASRARLGESWRDRYLTSPLWRFANIDLLPMAMRGRWSRAPHFRGDGRAGARERRTPGADPDRDEVADLASRSGYGVRAPGVGGAEIASQHLHRDETSDSVWRTRRPPPHSP